MPITGNTAGGAVAEPEEGGNNEQSKGRGSGLGLGLGSVQHRQPHPPHENIEYGGENDSNNLLLEKSEGPSIEEIPSTDITFYSKGSDSQDNDIQASNSSPPTTAPQNYVVSSISTAPVTVERPAFQPSLSCPLQNAGTARANLAPSVRSPTGTTTDAYASKHAHETVLQAHCSFFDRSGSGVIWPHDTFISFYHLGFGIFLSLFSVVIIHSNFSYPTLDSWIPDPFFRIYLKNIHMDKHGSDTLTYDHEGRFVPQNFEDIFEKHAEGREWITIWEVARMLRAQRNLADPIGWGGALFECGFSLPFSFCHVALPPLFLAGEKRNSDKQNPFLFIYESK
jgi:hypothetical protein